MHLRRFTDYALRVLILVATSPRGQATIRETARAFAISEHHLVKVVQLLAREGVLANSRGRGGGLRLAQAPSKINLGRVVRAAEGESRIADCFDHGGRSCVIAGACRLSGIFRDALDAFYAVLDRHTLQDLLDRPEALVSILHRHETGRGDLIGVKPDELRAPIFEK
jgi:Rrf2 family nitric oxide-sensitive transcriptional repressor